MKQLLGRSPLPRIYGIATSGALRVLAFHGVPDRDAFAAQVDHLLDRYHPVGLDRIHDALHHGAALPSRAVLVTFDDGDHTVVEHGLPVLRDAGMPAVVYVVAGLIDSDRPFWWDEAAALFDRGHRAPGFTASSAPALVRALKDVADTDRRDAIASMRDSSDPVRQPQLTSDDVRGLVAGGFAIGNHSFSHPCLDRCDDEAVAGEIEQAHQRLTEILGEAPITFAYPNGSLDRRAEAVLRRLGYRSVFLFDHRIQPLPADPLRLSRLRVDTDVDLDTFRLLVSGAHSFLHHRVLRRP